MKKKMLSILTVCICLVHGFLFSQVTEANEKIKMDFARITLNQRIGDIPISGYVFFDGFDFDHYKPETGGIVPMLQKTHTLLRNNYAAGKQPFVFVGHSQGGLRALAMATKRGFA